MKARSDKREYRRIRLNNSLEALLISDPDTDKVIHSFFIFHSTFFGPSSYSQSSSGLIFFQCAASMSVSVGSFSDPVGLEGLAHFLGCVFVLFCLFFFFHLLVSDAIFISIVIILFRPNYKLYPLNLVKIQSNHLSFDRFNSVL